MDININLNIGPNGQPIDVAGAIIRWYMDGCQTAENVVQAREDLKAVSEHIAVYLRNRSLDIDCERLRVKMSKRVE